MESKFFSKLLLLTLGWLLSGNLLAGPVIQTWQTANGAKVLYVPAPEIPMVDVRVVFDAGSARDGDNLGVTSLTNTLLTEGAGDWSANEISERLENVGSSLDTGSLRDMAWASVRSLTEQNALNTTLDTLAAVLAQPRFNTEDLERERQATLASLLQDEQSPGTTGKKRLYHLVYGDHPYATDSEGTTASVKALTRKKIVATYKQLYVARNALVAIVGAVDREQAEAIAERVVGGLKSGEHSPKLPPVPELKKAVVETIEFPSTQSHIYVGQPGIRRGDPDYFPLYVGNHILGGSGLVSLLSEEVREKRGLAYSVYSYFLLMRQPGLFQMGLQTKNSQAQQALQVLTDTLQRFVEDGPTKAQLTAAKQNITGGFPLRISSNSKIVEYLAVIGFYNLPLDYLDAFTGKIESVTADQIRSAFRRRVHPDRMVTVRVGKIGDR
ncbi:MAG: zinc protease [Gammaproteobacteria bacterium (ex Lamellibrachia satsuma)]|nr:MAG: insulinase family protein [Gammaproteobacteria bacterium (ex Lamellibrachia satsuma)]RRS32427.1 MAG: zinc protease [Gammaproteobacteria bacterium (ex Lamellibrachia satsuma)]RRS34522.1 MAG: zinc protease [Gammaproteobacteria bacterium (ex Lamellibrachia satsuma)]